MVHPLETARIAAGLTVAEVAVEFTRDARTIRRWELGQNHPPTPVLQRLARLYATAASDLVAS